jgi:hypothetical protein
MARRAIWLIPVTQPIPRYETFYDALKGSASSIGGGTVRMGYLFSSCWYSIVSKKCHVYANFFRNILRLGAYLF